VGSVGSVCTDNHELDYTFLEKLQNDDQIIRENWSVIKAEVFSWDTPKGRVYAAGVPGRGGQDSLLVV